MFPILPQLQPSCRAVTRVKSEDGDFYCGRGMMDDKCAFFSSMIILQTLVDLDMDFPTVHVIVETEEESGSPNLEPRSSG